jgi:hypothetical protein
MIFVGSKIETYIYLMKFLPDIENDLTEFGHKVATNIYDLHLECEKVVTIYFLNTSVS